jgi:hypothetical protein
MKNLKILVFTIVASSFAFPIIAQDAEVVKALKKSDFYRGGSEGIEWDVKVQNIEQGELRNDLTISVEGTATDDHFYS